jgi:hypothetical protein
MSNWIGKHLVTCFFTIIGLMFFLSSVSIFNIYNIKKTAEGKADTLAVNRSIQQIMSSIDDFSAKQDILLNYAKTGKLIIVKDAKDKRNSHK